MKKIRKKNRYLYNSGDSGPYHVYVENISTEFRGKLNAIKINEIIYSMHPELDHKIKEIDSIGRNRIRITFKDGQSANRLVGSERLLSQGLESYIPRFLVIRQGVISDIHVDLEEDYLKNKIKMFDLHCKFEVISVNRIKKYIIDKETKEKKLSNTKSVIVTCRTQILPKYIAIGHVRSKVSPYIQKVVLCYNCFRYGHSSNQCKSKGRCLNCQGDHKINECTEEKEIQCFYCEKNSKYKDDAIHATNEIKKCKEFTRQKQIKKAMTEQNMSNKDAEKLFPRQTYAKVVDTNKITENRIIDCVSTDFKEARSSNPINSQNRSAYFTQIKTPQKRIRTLSPSPTLESHNQIISQFNFSQGSGSILSDPIYQAGISNNHLTQTSLNKSEINVNNMVDLVISVLDILKEKRLVNINKSELTELINLKMQEKYK